VRICLLTPEFHGLTPAPGGIGHRYRTTARELVRQGHDVHVVVGRGAARSRRMTLDGATVHLVAAAALGLRGPPKTFAAGMAVVDRIARLGTIDVIYAPEWRGDGWWMARWPGRPCFVTNLTTSLAQIRSLDPSPQGSAARLRIAAQQRRERIQTEHSDAVVAVSSSILRWTRDLWDIERLPTAVVPNTIDVQRVRRMAARVALPTQHPGRDGPVVAFSGRLESRKGIHVLAAAMNAVWRVHPGARLVAAGRDCGFDNAPMSQHLRAVAGANADRVHVLGEQAPEQLFAVLVAADVVAVPSLWEAFGLAALEAMALGCAVVGTTGGGYADFMTDGQDALMVAPGDAEALGGALLRLIDDAALRAQIGRHAAARADEYAPQAVVGRLVDVFARVVGGDRVLDC